MQAGMLSQAAGSAYVEFGNTKVMAGVCAPVWVAAQAAARQHRADPVARGRLARYGPRESDRREAFSEQGRLQCDVKVATFATRRRGNFGQARPCAIRARALRARLAPRSAGDRQAWWPRSSRQVLARARPAARPAQ
jgi:ribonuclease PH